MRITSLVAAGALVCALALGACGSSSDSGGGGDVTAFCGKVKELQSLANPFASVKPGDVQGAKDAVDKIHSEIASIDDVAPDAVKADVDKVEKTIAGFASDVQDAGTPQEFLKAAQSFQAKSATVQSTVANLRSYTQKNCGKS